MNVCRCLKKEKHVASEPANSTSEWSTYFYMFLYTSLCKRGIGPSTQSYIRDIDVTRTTRLSSADVRMTVFMSFGIRTDSFIVWAVNPRNSSDNLTVRVIPFILSGVLQSNFSLAISIAIHQYYSFYVVRDCLSPSELRCLLFQYDSWCMCKLGLIIGLFNACCIFRRIWVIKVSNS